MRDTACFVQFPHPGLEHSPATDVMPWNVAGHRRKFLIGPGRYVDADDRLHHGEVVFWGEWEPPSQIVRRWPRDGQLPRVLHRPSWARPATAAVRQNTDPWVFGEQMLYSNCKQITGTDRRPTSMQRLPRGSVICFGSTLDHEFRIDTVFVVASSQPWTAAEPDTLDVDEAFTVCTAETITACGIDTHTPLTLYRSATLDAPVHGMYSFVPARPADHPQPRFGRPPVQLPGLINPASRQSTWGSRRQLPMSTVQDAWAALRDQVLAADLVLATHLTTPAHQPATTPIPTTTRRRC
jgi:hypothetical protein